MSETQDTVRAAPNQRICLTCNQPFTRAPKDRRLCCSEECAGKRSREIYNAHYQRGRSKILARSKKSYEDRRSNILSAAKDRYQNDPVFREQAKARSTKSKHTLRSRDPDGYREQWRNKHLVRNYNLTHDQYNAMLAAQDGKCAVCGAAAGIPGTNHSLNVDHDHKTGKVRGLLCMTCNRGIGSFKDSPELLVAAAAYLKNGGTHVA